MSKKWATEAKPLASNPRPEDDQTDLPVGLVVNPQRPSVKRRRGRRRDKLASSSGQGIDAFTSAQDVSIVGSTFNLTTVHHYGPEGSKGLPSSRGSQSPSHDQSLPVPCLNEEKPYNAGDAASIPHRSDSSSSRIYYEQLLSKLRGVPLWLPGPNANLPIDYRLRGAHIGDVGTITEFGGFSFLFNVFEEADSEINQGSVPDGFKPLRWISNSAYMKGKGTGDLGVRFSDVEKHAVYESGSWIGSETVEEINVLDSVSSGGLTFQTRALEGAILAMPYGATSHDLTNRRLLQDYMSKNLEQWYIYANHERGRQARNGDIRLVYGCDKASSWGIATFKYEQGSGNLSGTHVAKRIHFKPAGSTSKSNTEIATAFTWSSMGGESGRVGPSDKVMKGLYAHLALNAEAFRHPVYGYDDVAIENQSVFLRTLNATLATSTWTKWMSEDIDSFHDETSDSQFRDGQDYDRGGAREGGGSSNSSNAEHFPGNGSSSWGSNIEHTMMEGQPLYPIHPSDVLNRSLLRQFPHAQMAITADADWISVLSHGDSLETASLLRLGFHRLHFERLLHHTHQIVEIDGVIRIDKKSVISLQEREESTFRPTWKRHPGFYKRDGDLRFLAGITIFKIQRKMLPESVKRLLSAKARKKWTRGFTAVFLVEEVTNLLAECMTITPRIRVDPLDDNGARASSNAAGSVKSTQDTLPFFTLEKVPASFVDFPLSRNQDEIAKLLFKQPAVSQTPFSPPSSFELAFIPSGRFFGDDARSINSLNSLVSSTSGGTVSTKATSVSSHSSWRSIPKSSSNTSEMTVPRNIRLIDGVPWELGSLPRSSTVHGDMLSSSKRHTDRLYHPKLNTILERPASSTPLATIQMRNSGVSVAGDVQMTPSHPDGSVKEVFLKEGETAEPEVKKVPKSQINALSKILRALRR